MPTPLDHARIMRKEPTPAERTLWQALRAKQIDGHKWRRQAPIGPYLVDFFCPELRLVVEVDGATHADPETDAKRTAWLQAHAYWVLRFWNSDVLGNLPGVLDRIARHCAEATPPLAPPSRGGGSSLPLRKGVGGRGRTALDDKPRR